MPTNDFLKRLALIKEKPELVKEFTFTPSEYAEMLFFILEHLKNINSAITGGRLKGEPGKNAEALVPGKHYLSLTDGRKAVNTAVEKELKRLTKDFREKMKSIKPGKDGADAKVTKKHLAEVAEMVLAGTPQLIESMITREAESIRNGLELLQGDNRLSVKAITGIDEVVAQIYEAIGQARQGGGGSKYRIRAMLDIDVDGIADGQTLVWNAERSVFEPGNASGSSPVNDTITVQAGWMTQVGQNVEIDLSNIPGGYIAIRKVFRNGLLADAVKWSIVGNILTYIGAVTTNSFQLEYVH